MKTRRAALYGLAAAFAIGAAVLPALPSARTDGLDPTTVLVDQPRLEELRRNGDNAAQREHVWALLAELTRSVTGGEAGKPLFETWHGEGELFGSPAPNDPAPGIEGFYRSGEATLGSSPPPDVPVLTYTLYNDPAYHHIVDLGLNRTSRLDELLRTGPADTNVSLDRSVPQFPATAIVMKTVWWPVAKDGTTAMPVWDAEGNPPLGHGNPYTTWNRVVGVEAAAFPADSTVALDFAGTSYSRAHRVPLEAFSHVRVDAGMARRINADPPSAKAMLIALGRPLEAGDYLALVGANLAARELPNWIWVTLWWHDRPDDGAFAEGRPAGLAGAWRNYLMQAAYDTALPAAPDGGPHIAFNPWLEGRFPDGGHGPGVQSNCMACHERASYPTIRFLPVTRGPPDFENDAAYAPGRLRTSFLWTLAMHAKP